MTRAEQIRREKEHEASLKQQGAEVEEGLDCIAELLGDSAQKHARWGQTSAEQAKLLKGHGARGEQHAALAERVDCVEKLLGDSA